MGYFCSEHEGTFMYADGVPRWEVYRYSDCVVRMTKGEALTTMSRPSAPIARPRLPTRQPRAAHAIIQCKHSMHVCMSCQAPMPMLEIGMNLSLSLPPFLSPSLPPPSLALLFSLFLFLSHSLLITRTLSLSLSRPTPSLDTSPFLCPRSFQHSSLSVFLL